MLTSSSPHSRDAGRPPAQGAPITTTSEELSAALSGCPVITAIMQRLDELRDIVQGKSKSHYTVEEVAEMTGRAPFTVRRWITEGRLPATRVAGTGPKGRLLIARADVQRLITDGLAGKVQALDV